jgi:hypothetical protein
MKTLFGLALCSWLFAFGSVVHADEDTKVDCSRISEFSDNGPYYKDDKVKYKASWRTGLREYNCSKDVCRGEPESDASWKVVGKCE